MKSLLQHGMASQAHRRGDATAVMYLKERLTYAQLDRASTQLAKVLKEIGCERGDRVCLLMPKSLPAIVSILGILKADCAYVPIDPQSPAPRVQKIIDQCEPRVFLGAGAVGTLLEEVLSLDGLPDSLSVGWLGPDKLQSDRVKVVFTQADYENYPDTPLDYANTADDPAYIMFTSGSTGVPKGVVITHANVSRYLQWAVRYFGLTSSDKMSSHPPLHFDLSVMDIFGSLGVGAELHLVPYEINLLPNKVADFIRNSELTHWFSVPSLLNYMAKFDVIKEQDFKMLKRILWCGEVFAIPSLRYWMQRLPHVSFTNLYGPTETTIASSYYTVPTCPEDGTSPIPIGKPCEGEELLVLNEDLLPVPTGEIGNLYIRGAGLSPGYWRDQEKTQAAFIRNPFNSDPSDRLYKTGDLASIGDDGLVYFHGRADTQIKSRGYRIELGEIESAFHAMSLLQECAVVAIETEGFEGATICCAYVPADGSEVSSLVLRKSLARVLPQYMIPSQYRVFEKLPKNASGKIDRPKLRDEFRQQKHDSGRGGV
jgi:amino acid adenylation domain-containing protein